MRVITNRRLVEFSVRYPAAALPLQVWRKRVEARDYTSHAELKRAFAAVDKVGDLYVFDIGGNKWRLVAFVHFGQQICYIKQVLTHAEYGLGKWRNI